MKSRTSLRNPPTQGIFYGWVVVGTVFVILTTTAGLGFYNASVILKAATDELGVRQGPASFGPTLFFSISGITGFLLARRLNDISVKWFYLAGGVVGSLALGCLRWVDTLPKYYLFFAVYGVSFALAGLVPGTTLVARWFDRNRATALSIASTGLSLGGILLTPFAARSIAAHGLADASNWMSVVWFIGVVPLAMLFLRDFPADLGLEPDGAPRPPQPRAVDGAPFNIAVRSPFFLWMCLAYAMIFLAQVGGIAQLYSLAAERVDTDTAAISVSTLAFTSVVARLAGGVVLRWVSIRAVTMTLTLAQAGALACLANAGSRTTLLASTMFFGLSVGNLLMLQPLLLADAFGVKDYSRIYSLNQLVGTIGVAGGPYLLGLIHDLANFRVSFLVASAANIVGFVAVVLAGPVAKAQSLWKSPEPSLTLTSQPMTSAKA